MRFHLAGLAVAGLAAAGVLAATPAVHAASAASASTASPANAAPAASAAPAANAARPVQNPSSPSTADLLAPMLGTLKIGNPMPDLPDCADKRTPDGTDVTAFCVEVRGDGAMRQVGVPRKQRPAFMDGPHALAVVDRNALVGLIVPTDGVRSEQSTLRTLTARYGKPFREEQVALLDKDGKTVNSVHAGWMQAPLTVEVYSIPDDPDTGSIELLLPRARTVMAQKDAAITQQLNPGAASAPSAPKAVAQKPKKGEGDGKPGSW
ncbi:hypothetical protein N6G03_24025 [Cupriavidus gilardii]|uniref:Uncharacterized protein n=1 Tax=Cupriavidus gilardii TaxID=82541 RepID=A0ABY4VTI3_9BURK|nr:hypothetical protein [Cupriavidus gilardii]MCT9127699.1 hypothetical protein [Cupriavidus gilardii]USE80479.1 hypothetical protein NDR89_11930 [Cupriavidus gilardii]